LGAVVRAPGADRRNGHVDREVTRIGTPPITLWKSMMAEARAATSSLAA
jgi:hypothetical protein